MKIKRSSKTKQLLQCYARRLFIIPVICLLVLQESEPSIASSIMRVEPSVIELQNQAFYNLRRGRFLEVFKKCEELLTINEKSLLAYELLGTAYAGIGRFDKAQELLESLKDVAGNSSLLHLTRGMILHSQKKFDEAIEECQKSITIDKDNPLALYAIGRIYIDRKDYHKADEYLKKAVESEPELAAAYTGLGINYLLQGKIGESYNSYNKALEINQGEHMARMGLATIFTGLKNYDNAIEQFNLVIEKIPNFIMARQNLAALYLQIGRFNDAIEQSNEIQKLSPDIAPVYLILARSFSYTDNFDDAIINIRKYIELEKSSFEGNYLLGIFLMASGDIKASKSALEKAETIDAKQGKAMIASALIHHVEGSHNKAEVYLKKAQELIPEIQHPTINIFLTNLYLTQGKYKASQKSLKLSDDFINGFKSDKLVLKPDSERNQSFAHTNLAIFFYLNKWFDRAIKMCEAAFVSNPDNPFNLYMKGRSLIDKKNFNQALVQFKKIIEMQPDFVSPHHDLARLYLIMDETEKALEEYTKLAELDPKNAAIHLTIGNIYSRQGKNDEAINKYRLVISLTPDSPVGYNELAYHYAEGEINLDEGLEYALKATELAPKDPAIMDTLGWIYFKKEDYEKAIENLTSSVQLKPNSSTIRFHLGMAYYKNHDLKKALSEFKTALTISGRFKEAAESKKMIELIQEHLKNP